MLGFILVICGLPLNVQSRSRFLEGHNGTGQAHLDLVILLASGTVYLLVVLYTVNDVKRSCSHVENKWNELDLT
jgi:hypothetical protein